LLHGRETRIVNLVPRYVSIVLHVRVFRSRYYLPTRHAMTVVIHETGFVKGCEMKHLIPEGT